MSDLLDDLVKASREAPVQHDEADETRRRILAVANHRARTSSSRRLAPWVLPLVAALVATGALAAGPLGVTEALFGPPAPPVTAPAASPSAVAAKGSPRGAHTEAVVPDAPASDEPPPVVVPPVVAPAVVEPAAEAPVVDPAARPALPAAATLTTATPGGSVRPPRADAVGVRSNEPTARPEPPQPSAVDVRNGTTPPAPPVPPRDPSDDLYRSAHDAHFRGGSPSAAIEAWDRYLAAAPRGRFAVEARYNRALALLKAGRRAEGLAALEPFASGAFGNYRRDEAQRLLGAARDAGAP